MTSYTPAQLRALEWLPKDGSWRDRTDTDPSDYFGLFCLWNAHEEFVVECWTPNRVRLRLTPAGVAERARLAKEGGIK